MEPPVATAEERDLDRGEVGEQRPDLRRREHVHVRRIAFGLTPEEEAKPVLDPKRVRHGADEDPARLEDTMCLGDERLWEANVFEQLTGDDGVEGLALERQRLLDVGRDDVDAELLRFRQRRLVHVDADDVVPSEEVASESAGAATEIEHLLALTDRLLEERDPLGDEDEIAGVSALAVVSLVQLPEATWRLRRTDGSLVPE